MNAIIQIQTQCDRLVEGMSNDEYHACPEFSSSQLKDILRSPAHFYSYNIKKEHEREEKKHLDFGTLAHTLFLEPEKFEKEFVVLPADAPKRPTEAQLKAKNPAPESIERMAWWSKFEAENVGKIIISAEQLDGAKRIVENMQKLSIAKEMARHFGLAEANIFFTDPIYDLSLRIRPDYLIAPCKAFPFGLIIDVKTARDARPHAFSKACADYGYDLSAAMYREGFQKFYETREKPPFIYLVAENDAPFNAKQYKASDLFLSVGEARYNKAKEYLAEALLINEWDGYSQELEDLYLPSYLTKQALDAEFN